MYCLCLRVHLCGFILNVQFFQFQKNHRFTKFVIFLLNSIVLMHRKRFQNQRLAAAMRLANTQKQNYHTFVIGWLISRHKMQIFRTNLTKLRYYLYLYTKMSRIKVTNEIWWNGQKHARTKRHECQLGISFYSLFINHIHIVLGVLVIGTRIRSIYVGSSAIRAKKNKFSRKSRIVVMTSSLRKFFLCGDGIRIFVHWEKNDEIVVWEWICECVHRAHAVKSILLLKSYKFSFCHFDRFTLSCKNVCAREWERASELVNKWEKSMYDDEMPVLTRMQEKWETNIKKKNSNEWAAAWWGGLTTSKIRFVGIEMYSW